MNRRQRTIVIGCLIAVNLLGGFVAPLVIHIVGDNSGRHGPSLIAFIAFILAGGLGQVGLLAGWFALGPEFWAQRVLKTLVLLTLGCYVVIFGLRLSSFPFLNFDFRVALTVFVVGIAVFLSAQIPMWAIRVVLRRRIRLVLPNDDAGAAKPSQFGIRHLLIWMAIVGAVLALGRIALPMPAQESVRLKDLALFITTNLVLIMPMTAMLVVVPCALACLVRRNIAQWLIVAGIYLAALSLVEFAAVLLLIGGRGPDNSEVLFVVIAFDAGAAVVCLYNLLIIRVCGYRLVRSGNIPTERPHSEPPASELP